MAWEKDIKRGRKKGMGSNQVTIRIYKQDKSDKYGQCRITIPRSIVRLLRLKNNDIIEFKEKSGNFYIQKVYEEM